MDLDIAILDLSISLFPTEFGNSKAWFTIMIVPTSPLNSQWIQNTKPQNNTLILIMLNLTPSLF